MSKENETATAGNEMPEQTAEHVKHAAAADVAGQTGDAGNVEPGNESVDENASGDMTASATDDEIRHYTGIIEAALLVSGEAVAEAQLGKLFDPPLPLNFVRHLLTDLKEAWKDRQVELVCVAGGWRFQGKAGVQHYLERLSPEKSPRYSRAVMETLAIIAYRQPATRGDIEAIRGVAVSSGTIKALEDRQWIEAVGHRETPGRPALYATTKNFLNDLGLCSLAELPPLAELDSSHLLEMPDAPAKAAEAPLALASPILSGNTDDLSTEPGVAGLRGEPADQGQEDH